MTLQRTSHAPASVLAVLASGAPEYAIAVFAHADAAVEMFRARQDELLGQCQGIVDAASTDKRDMSVEERADVERLTAEFERVGQEIALRERVSAQAAQLEQPRGRLSDPDPIDQGDQGGAVITNAQPDPLRPQNPGRQLVSANGSAREPVYPTPRRNVAGNGGFYNFGDFAQAVKNANPHLGGRADERLLRNAAATTYSQEGVGSDGGFLVPTDFRTAILSKVFSEDSLIGRTDKLVSSSNNITMPVDATTPYQTTGGPQAYWVGEAQVKPQSNIVFENLSIKLNNLAVLMPVTEELLEDAPSLDGYLRRKVPERLDFKISWTLVWGTGAGQPLGIMNSPALVIQAAEGAQTADTVNATNIFKMYSRMPSPSRSTAVWLMHPDVEPQLLGMMMPGNTYPAYLPPGGLSQSPYGSLLGRPVIPHQAAKTVGDLGDIIFVDFQQYMSVVKTGAGRDANGMRTDVSIHLWFDQDLVAYRFTLRLGGMPWWSAVSASLNGSHTLSPYIALAAR